MLTPHVIIQLDSVHYFVLLYFQVLFCKYGVLEAMRSGKGFIDFSTMDGETLNDADEVCVINFLTEDKLCDFSS